MKIIVYIRSPSNNMTCEHGNAPAKSNKSTVIPSLFQ